MQNFPHHLYCSDWSVLIFKWDKKKENPISCAAVCTHTTGLSTAPRRDKVEGRSFVSIQNQEINHRSISCYHNCWHCKCMTAYFQTPSRRSQQRLQWTYSVLLRTWWCNWLIGCLDSILLRLLPLVKTGVMWAWRNVVSYCWPSQNGGDYTVVGWRQKTTVALWGEKVAYKDWISVLYFIVWRSRAGRFIKQSRTALTDLPGNVVSALTVSWIYYKRYLSSMHDSTVHWFIFSTAYLGKVTKS